jgi:hypothetical protein
MRKLLVALGLGAAVTLGAGASIAQNNPTPPGPPPGVTMPHDQAARDAMHAQMRDSMPADLRARCDEMHAAMAGTDMGAMMGGHTGGGMMGPHMGNGPMMGSSN